MICIKKKHIIRVKLSSGITNNKNKAEGVPFEDNIIICIYILYRAVLPIRDIFKYKHNVNNKHGHNIIIYYWTFSMTYRFEKY